MTNENLIHEIVNLYKIAKTSTTKFTLTQIKRGRNHSISSQAEDLLAFFIVQRCSLENCEVWVDYPISFKTKSKTTKSGNPGTKTIYPDISLVRKNEQGQNEIYEMIDLKMDLGWKRELESYLNQKLNLVKEMRASRVATYKKIDANGYKMKNKARCLFRTR